MAGVDRQAVRVWNVHSTDGENLRVATIEQGPREKGMCDGCSAPCCKGMLNPVLTEKEFLSKKLQTTFLPVPGWLKKRVPRAQRLVAIAMTEHGCPYHDSATNSCMIWPDCPKSCLAYDCRGDDRPEIKAFAKEREREWLRR